MKYTQLLMDKSKEELAMLCMDQHRLIKRLTEANAKLRERLNAREQVPAFLAPRPKETP